MSRKSSRLSIAITQGSRLTMTGGTPPVVDGGNLAEEFAHSQIGERDFLIFAEIGHHPHDAGNDE